MRNASNVIALTGGAVWAALSAWHALIIVRFGWPEAFWLGHLFMAGPAIALAGHALIFSFSRIRQTYWGLGLEMISLLFGLALGYVEISMHFIGYK